MRDGSWDSKAVWFGMLLPFQDRMPSITLLFTCQFDDSKLAVPKSFIYRIGRFSNENSTITVEGPDKVPNLDTWCQFLVEFDNSITRTLTLLFFMLSSRER